jgi:hypothetical protein
VSLLHDPVNTCFQDSIPTRERGREGGREGVHSLTTNTHAPYSNHFPPHYAENISEQNLPVELFAQYTTVEYELQVPPAGTEGGREGGREGGLARWDVWWGYALMMCLSVPH